MKLKGRQRDVRLVTFPHRVVKSHGDHLVLASWDYVNKLFVVACSGTVKGEYGGVGETERQPDLAPFVLAGTHGQKVQPLTERDLKLPPQKFKQRSDHMTTADGTQGMRRGR